MASETIDPQPHQVKAEESGARAGWLGDSFQGWRQRVLSLQNFFTAVDQYAHFRPGWKVASNGDVVLL